MHNFIESTSFPVEVSPYFVRESNMSCLNSKQWAVNKS